MHATPNDVAISIIAIGLTKDLFELAFAGGIGLITATALGASVGNSTASRPDVISPARSD